MDYLQAMIGTRPPAAQSRPMDGFACMKITNQCFLVDPDKAFLFYCCGRGGVVICFAEL